MSEIIKLFALPQKIIIFFYICFQDDLLNFETEAIGYADPQGDNKLGLSHENITNRSGIKAPPTNILGHDEPINNKANGVIGISHTPFASLNAISDHKIHSKMENWDQDV